MAGIDGIAARLLAETDGADSLDRADSLCVAAV